MGRRGLNDLTRWGETALIVAAAAALLFAAASPVGRLFVTLQSGSILAAEEDGGLGTVEITAPKRFDPSSLEGLTPAQVRSSIPSDWTRVPSKTGGGEVFRDPANPGRQIRIMPGYPAGSRPDLITTGPYAVVSQNGVVTKVPLFGNPVLQ